MKDVLHSHSSSSSSSSTLDGGTAAVADVEDDAAGSDTAASSAALKLCVVPYFSAALVMSILGRAFFKGLPISASADISLPTFTAPGG